MVHKPIPVEERTTNAKQSAGNDDESFGVHCYSVHYGSVNQQRPEGMVYYPLIQQPRLYRPSDRSLRLAKALATTSASCGQTVIELLSQFVVVKILPN